MDRNGVAGAVTSSLDGLTHNDAEGNRATLALCGGEPRLLPAAVVMPGRYLEWRSHLEEALDAGCLLVKLFVDEHRWTASAQRFRDVVAALAGRPFPPPLLLCAPPGEEIAPFADATAGTGVPVILAGTNYATLGECLAVMERHPHVFLETSRAASPATVEVVAQAVGPGRLVFGSGAPLRPVAGALHAVLGAALSDREKGLILGGTLAGLLRIDPAGVPAPARPPALRSYRGRILDVHTHLGAGTWRFPIPSSGVRGLTGVLRDAGVERAIASSIYAITTDLRAGNERLVAALEAAPELLGYVTVNPQHPEQSAAELRRLETNQKLVGVKIHAEYSKTPTSAPAMRRLFELIAPYRRPVKIHNAGADWMPALAGLAGAFPDLPIIVAHGGEWGSGPFFRDHPNVCFEFCSSAPEQGLIDECLAAVGPQRLLFGSDADLLSPRFMLGVYADASIPADVAPLVYYENAARLFRL